MGRKPPHPRRGAGLGPTKPRERRPWLQSEVHSLRVAFATFGDDWGKVVAALTKDGHDVRTLQPRHGANAASVGWRLEPPPP